MAGEEGSRVAAQETRARLVGKFRDVPPPPRPGTAGAFREEARADMPGAPGLGLGAAGESVQAVSCAPGGTGCSRAGPGGTPGSRGSQDFPSRPSSASSVPWLDRAWAAQGTWGGGGGDMREGRMAPRGLECRAARVAKLPSELQLGKSSLPLWA